MTRAWELGALSKPLRTDCLLQQGRRAAGRRAASNQRPAPSCGEQLGTRTMQKWAPPSLHGRQGCHTYLGAGVLSQTAGSRQRAGCTRSKAACKQHACWCPRLLLLGRQPSPCCGQAEMQAPKTTAAAGSQASAAGKQHAFYAPADLKCAVTVQVVQPRLHMGVAQAVCRDHSSDAGSQHSSRCKQHAPPDLVGRGCAPGRAWQPPCAVCALSRQR